MFGTMRTVAAAGMALATAGGAYAGGPDFRVSFSLGGCGPVICPPVSCEPVVRYRQETVCDTVPRTEVWYDACGRRHTRIVYEKVYRTVWVPIEDCHTGTTIVIRDRDRDHHGWRDRDDDRWRDRDRWRGHDRRDGHAGGWDERRGDGRDRRAHSDAAQEPARRLTGDAAASGRLIPSGPMNAAPEARVIGAGRELRGAERLMARAQQR